MATFVAVFIIDDGPCPTKFFCPWLLITCACVPLFLSLPNLISFLHTSQHFSILNLVSPSAAVHHIVGLIVYMSWFRFRTERARRTVSAARVHVAGSFLFGWSSHIPVSGWCLALFHSIRICTYLLTNTLLFPAITLEPVNGVQCKGNGLSSHSLYPLL